MFPSTETLFLAESIVEWPYLFHKWCMGRTYERLMPQDGTCSEAEWGSVFKHRQQLANCLDAEHGCIDCQWVEEDVRGCSRRDAWRSHQRDGFIALFGTRSFQRRTTPRCRGSNLPLHQFISGSRGGLRDDNCSLLPQVWPSWPTICSRAVRRDAAPTRAVSMLHHNCNAHLHEYRHPELLPIPS